MSTELQSECPCDLCGCDEPIEIPSARFHTAGQSVQVCSRCGFVYVRNRRSAAAIARAWSDDLYGTEYTARIPAVKARLTYVADFTDMQLNLKGKKVCDIGAGEGVFLKILRDEYAAEVFGIEPSRHNCRLLGEMNIRSFQGTIEDYALATWLTERRADVVTLLWTLECCRSPRDMLNAAWNVLNEDGHMVVGTGSRILVPFKKTMTDFLSTSPLDTHPVHFSANTLSAMLAVCGFETVHVNRYFDTDYLCVIGRKRPRSACIKWTGDDPARVLEFFERWHQDSLWHRNAA
jgi:2-polyprenyl-3-methyl-5-hydroxy-6-metoxy-1,4-benzoquinol methylase